MRITYKSREGERFTIGTIWPSRVGKGFNLQPCLETKETKYGKEMSILDAFKAAFVDRSGFVDFWPVDGGGAKKEEPLPIPDFPEDDQDNPF
jgi:hypothetical protein